MFAIALISWWLTPRSTTPKGVSQAYADIGSTLTNFGFNRVQGSLYTTSSEVAAG